MNKIKKAPACYSIALVAAISSGMLAGMPSANAADIPVVPNVTFTNISVDNSGDLKDDRILYVNERVFQEFSFNLPDTAQPGDKFLVSWSLPFEPVFDNVLAFNTADGTHIMDGKIVRNPDVARGNATLELTVVDTAAGLQDRSGSARIPLKFSGKMPKGIDRTVNNALPLEMYINGEKVFTGESYWALAFAEYSTQVNIGAVPDAKVPGSARVAWYGAVSKSDKTRDVTCTFKPLSENLKFDPTKVRISSVYIDRSIFENEVPDEDDATNWEVAFEGEREIIKATENEVVAVIKGVPAGYAMIANFQGGVATIDGNDYQISGNCVSDGSTGSGVEKTPTAAAVSISGVAEGEAIKPSMTVESLVSGKDADTDKDAHKATLPTGTKTTKLPYEITVKNTGNVPLGAPTVTNGAGYSKTFFDVSIPVGGSHTFKLGEIDTPLGKTSWNWKVTANGASSTDPTVTVLEEQKQGTVTAKFLDETGKEIAKPVVVANKVNVGTDYDTTKVKKQTIPGKDGKRYELVKVTGAEKGKVTEGATTVTYQYQTVGSWVPTLPGKELPAIPYPFTPGKPITPGTDNVIPHVPGYVPVGPDGNPLKPVDPNDLTKGFVPPVPAKPGENTIINYIPVGTPDEFTTEQGTPATFTPADNDGEGIKVKGLIDPKTGDVSNKVEIPGEGTWEVTPDGKVTFTPNEDFAGPVTPVSYIPVDGNGLEGKPVEITGTVTPKGNPDEFTVEQGKTVTITPADNDGKGTKPGNLIDPKTGDKVKEVTVPGEGTYKLNEDGTVTFTPEDGFTGDTTPVSYVPVSENGTEGKPVEITGKVTPKKVEETPAPEAPAKETPAPEAPVSEGKAPVAGSKPHVQNQGANTGADALVGAGLLASLAGALGLGGFAAKRRAKKN